MQLAQVDSAPSDGGWLWCVHGMGVEVRCAVAGLVEAAGAFAAWEEPALPPGMQVVRGEVLPYDADTVVRHLSHNARPVTDGVGFAELWQDPAMPGVYWSVDERWGLGEINLPKRTWRSWVLDHAAQNTADLPRLMEQAVLAPMAQLLRTRGLHVVPAASVSVGAGSEPWSLLLMCPFNLQPELTRLVDDGFDVIGQRWTALREEDGAVALLGTPALLEQSRSPRLMRLHGASDEPDWVSLSGRHVNHGFADAVILVDAGRRGGCEISPVGAADAANAIRNAWPLPPLDPHRHAPTLAAKLAEQCNVFRVELSREPLEFVGLIDLIRPSGAVRRAA
ncbi:MAG: hypothetical protein AAF656_02730 [Planctomycetota bacterium]